VVGSVLGSFTLIWVLQKFPTLRWGWLSLGIFLGYSQALFPLRMRELMTLPFSSVEVPAQAVYLEGKKIGLEKIGNVFIDETRLALLQNFRAVQKPGASPGKVFLDLTNRSALYAFFDEKCPVPLAADYLAFNEWFQQLNLKAIEKSPPPLVFLEPAIRHDGGPISLRSYRVYRWLLESGLYSLEQQGQVSFLTLKPEKHLWSADSLQLAEKIFHLVDLKALPTAWGRSWPILKYRFLEVEKGINYEKFILDPHHAVVRFTLASIEKRVGHRPDFLVFEIEANSRGKGVLRGKSSSSSPISELFSFEWKPGFVVLPLGSSPAWLLSSHAGEFELALESDSAPAISGISGYRLKK
jgi:hypothetical protein